MAVGHTSPRVHFLPRPTGETPAQSPGDWRRADGQAPWRLAGGGRPGGWRRLAASGWPGPVAAGGWRLADGGVAAGGWACRVAGGPGADGLPPADRRPSGRFDKPRPQPAGMEAPEGTGGDLRSTGPVAANKSTVSGRRRVPRSLALRPANLVPGTVPRIAPRTSLAVQPAPSGKTKCTTQGRATTMRLSTNISRYAPDLSPNLSPMWTGCGYTHDGGATWVVGSLD